MAASLGIARALHQPKNVLLTVSQDAITTFSQSKACGLDPCAHVDSSGSSVAGHSTAQQFSVAGAAGP